MKLYEETISEKEIFNGKIIRVLTQKVKLPNGKEANREIVKHSGAVAILPYINEKTVLMVKQFRKPIDSELLEIPAGKLEKGENPLDCAIRELEEETTYKAGNMEYIGKIVTSAGFSDEYIHIYRAKNLYKGQEGLEDEDEFLDLIEIDIDDLTKMIKTGQIIDSKTIAAVLFDNLN